jgi:hypothetical protein
VHWRWNGHVFGRVNPLVPATMLLAGLFVLVAGFRWIGGGIMVGALLALLNGLMLSRRVDFAADTGDLGRALLIMNIGLLFTCTIVAAAIIVMIHFSLAMAVAAAAGFAITHVAILATFYMTKARSQVPAEGRAS